MDLDHFLFVSHVSEDREAALKIVDELERRGVPCWIAPRNIEPGRPFDDEIATALEHCRAMLLIFSEQCNESEYIRREVTVAGENQKVIIPFRIEDAQPRRGLRVRLSDLHWLDGFAARERAIEELTSWFAPSADAPQRRITEAMRRPRRDEPRAPQPREEARPSAAPPDALPDPPSDVLADPAAAAPTIIAIAESATMGRPPRPGVAKRGPQAWAAIAAVLVLASVGGAAWFWLGRGGPKPMVKPPVAVVAPVVADPLRQGKAALDRKDYSEAMRWYRQAADLGNPVAQNYVGYFYENGLGVSQDYAAAMDWYRKSADQGRAAAQKNIGNLYEQGRGVTQDYAEAMRWYRMAADQGHPGAQTSVGYLFQKGLGVPQDYAEALRWYRMAAKQGEPTAENNIGVFYDKGYGVAQDYAEALRWYRMAADQGYIDAEYNLALLYADGHGVSSDLGEARIWMQKASNAGDSEARTWLADHGG